MLESFKMTDNLNNATLNCLFDATDASVVYFLDFCSLPFRENTFFYHLTLLCHIDSSHERSSYDCVNVDSFSAFCPRATLMSHVKYMSNDVNNSMYFFKANKFMYIFY